LSQYCALTGYKGGVGMDAVFTGLASAAMARVVRLRVTAGWERARTAVWRVLTDVDPAPGATITLRAAAFDSSRVNQAGCELHVTTGK
jgi:hypothetical protein